MAEEKGTQAEILQYLKDHITEEVTTATSREQLVRRLRAEVETMRRGWRAYLQNFQKHIKNTNHEYGEG